jgi:hypothetical protein
MSKTKNRKTVMKGTLEEGDVVTFSSSPVGNHKVSYPVKVVRRTSKNAWVLPVKFKTEKEFTLNPETRSYYSRVEEDELDIQTDENGEPITDDLWEEPRRFYKNKYGTWSEWGGSFGGSLRDEIKASCRQSFR